MTILAGVGSGEQDEDVIETAQDLATAFGENVVVVHVMSDNEFTSRRENRSDYYQDDAVADAAEYAQERAEAALDIDDLRTVTGIETDGTVGDPATLLLEKGTEHDARYIVIGGRKRTPVGKVIFGSVTQSILLDSNVPVVTVTDEE